MLFLFTLFDVALSKINAKFNLEKTPQTVEFKANQNYNNITLVNMVKNTEVSQKGWWTNANGVNYAPSIGHSLQRNKSKKITVENLEPGYYYSFQINLANGEKIHTDTAHYKGPTKKTAKKSDDKEEKTDKEDEKTDDGDSKTLMIVVLACVGGVMLVLILALLIKKCS